MKNLGQMMKQAQEMQAKFQEMQAKLSEIEITGTAGWPCDHHVIRQA